MSTSTICKTKNDRRFHEPDLVRAEVLVVVLDPLVKTSVFDVERPAADIFVEQNLSQLAPAR